MKKFDSIAILRLILLSIFCFSPAALATTAGQDKLRIVTGTPNKNGDSLFSTTVQWRVDGKHIIEATGLAFINGPDTPKPDDAGKVASKIKAALNDALATKYPASRGMEVSGPKKQPELTISNLQGYSFTRVTIGNYSNSSVSYDVLGKPFSSAVQGVSIDFVYSADVAYIDAFAPPKQNAASGGTIKISIDGQSPIEIQTENKSTSSIEQELAGAIAQATFSAESLIPHSKGGGKRNSKPFDGGEIQLQNLGAKTFTIDVQDPSLGVLTKFKFKDATKPADVAGPFKMIFSVVLIAAFAYFFFTWFRDSRKAKQDEA